MPKVSEEQEEVEEVTAPIYAWRAYRVEQIVRDYESQWVLTPLYYRGLVGGKPSLNSFAKLSGINIDLLGWNKADSTPEMDDAAKLPGFHCFHGYGQAVDYTLKARQGANHIDDVVIARVELGGVVVEHELGYRAEMTRVVALEHHDADEEKREKLAAALGWPFEIGYCDLLDEPIQRFFTDTDIEWFVEHARTLGQVYGVSVKQIANSLTRFAQEIQQLRLQELNDQMQKLLVKTDQVYSGFSIAPTEGALTDQLRRELELQIKNNWISGPASQKPFIVDPGA